MYKRFTDKLDYCLENELLTEKYYQILLELYNSYVNATIDTKYPQSVIRAQFDTLVDLIVEQIEDPFEFEIYHEKIVEPFNFYQFGVDFVLPLVDLNNSKVYGIDNIEKMQQQLSKKENVILLSNHQTEADPQAINIALKDKYKKFASNMIFIAGERVVTDPLAIPFSMGCNLLCIYSKKYLNVKPEMKHQRQIHNKKAMDILSKLLDEGGKVIYVAPSGGRDRMNEKKEIAVAPFDPQSVEMLNLMSKRASKKTHFYSLALDTFHLLPPPNSLQIEMGEERVANRIPVNLSFMNEIDMENFPGSDSTDKKEKRKNRAYYIWKLVEEEYKKITKGENR